MWHSKQWQIYLNLFVTEIQYPYNGIVNDTGYIVCGLAQPNYRADRMVNLFVQLVPSSSVRKPISDGFV